jgi:hypothetical protein
LVSLLSAPVAVYVPVPSGSHRKSDNASGTGVPVGGGLLGSTTPGAGVDVAGPDGSELPPLHAARTASRATATNRICPSHHVSGSVQRRLAPACNVFA